MIRGQAKFDGLTIGEFDGSFLGPPGAVRLEAKIAFVDSTTGNTHGWTKCTQWSKETLGKLMELRDAMEQDVAAVHFGSTATGTSQLDTRGPAGLGEFLETGKDAPQV